MDFLSLMGVVLAFAAILGGNLLEGGTVQTLFNGPAAIIVIGGTFAAIVLQSPRPILTRAGRLFTWIFMPPYLSMEEGLDKVVGWSLRSRKEGLLGLEAMAESEPEPFARKGLQVLVDGSEAEAIRSILEVELESREARDFDAARVYESMGGYAPTIGIIGAVMGLIQVMTNLEDPGTLGTGIATAFVATIYGVAFANLFLFPIASKLRSIVRQRSRYEEMMIDGLVAVAEGENPRSIELRLRGYIR